MRGRGRSVWLAVLPFLVPVCIEAQPAAPDTFVVRSAILAQDRPVFVSLPPSHASTDRAYPVILVLDGDENFGDAVVVASKLARIGYIPEAIVVAIPNPTSDPDDRVRDMTPPGLSVGGSSLNEGGDRFLDFLETELLPEVDRRYRGGRPRILIGHSSGGVIATYAAATRSDAFPIVVAIDAPIHLGDHWLAKRLIERAHRGGPAPVRYVSLEARFGWEDRRWAELAAAAPSGWVLDREKLKGESHESVGFLAMYEGLKLAFLDYSIVNAPIPPRGTAFGAFEYYRGIETVFDTELPPPAPVLRRLVEDLLIEGRVEPARMALAWLSEGYGSRQPEVESMIAHAAALPPLEETVEDLKAAPMPSQQDIAPFVGEWAGQVWMTPESRSDVELRVRIVDGAVAAEIVYPVGGGEELVMPVEYLRVVPGGLEFGHMNGMRPMGMIVFEGRREGDVLEGEQGFRGIVLPLPDGHMPPAMHFRLVKR
jgi:hypothetical protein